MMYLEVSNKIVWLFGDNFFNRKCFKLKLLVQMNGHIVVAFFFFF